MSSAPDAATPSTDAASLVFEPAAGGGLQLALGGRLDVRAAGRAWREAMARVDRVKPARLVVDASGLTYCDGAGLGLLVGLREHQERAGRTFELVGLRADLEELLRQYDPGAPPARPAARPFLERVGRGFFGVGASLRQLVMFVGELGAALAWAARHPRRVRWKDVWTLAERTGADALPLVLMLGFLIGLISAFQSAISLQRFAAEIFIADAVGIALFRELGGLMTAIILAGRSGSAFAAEIGTMKVNEELDALTTMGLAPVPFLVVTRVVAAVAVMPFLVLFFDLAGLLGALSVMLSIGYPAVTFYNRLTYAVTLGYVIGGLAKAVVYGILVAAIGCLRGLETGKGASAVGAAATSAVVSGIVLITIASGVFAVIFYVLRV